MNRIERAKKEFLQAMEDHLQKNKETTELVRKTTFEQEQFFHELPDYYTSRGKFIIGTGGNRAPGDAYEQWALSKDAEFWKGQYTTVNRIEIDYTDKIQWESKIAEELKKKLPFFFTPELELKRHAVRERRKALDRDNRKYALVQVGNTRFMHTIDDKTNVCYKVDTSDGYIKTWMKVPRFTFLRWANI